MDNVVELLSVAREEECPSSGSVADADNVSLNILRPIVRGGKRLVVSSVAGRGVRDGVLVEACEGKRSDFNGCLKTCLWCWQYLGA